MIVTNENKNMLMKHYDVLSSFREYFYSELILNDHLGDEMAIKVGEEQTFIFPARRNGKIFAIPSSIVEKKALPIRIKKTDKIAHRNNVYHYVTGYSSTRVAEKRTMSFKEMIDILSDFQHSNPEELKIYTIVTFMMYARKGFVRCVSEASFGKNSIPGIMKMLLSDIAIINPRSNAALEHKLMNKLLVLDELTMLEKAQRSLMQDSLLRIADGAPSYEKGTRGNAKHGTKDEYDITQLSIQIMYNVYEYYVQSGQGDKYFDNIFTFAVKDRFLPLHFEGTMDSLQFSEIDKPRQVMHEVENDILSLMRALKYYAAHIDEEDKDFKLWNTERLSKSGRCDKTFNTICQGLRMYAETEKEYNDMAEKVRKMYKRHDEMLKQNEVKEFPIEEEIGTGSPQRQNGLNSFIN